MHVERMPQIVAAGIYNAQSVYKAGKITPHRSTMMFELELPLADGGVSYVDNVSMSIRSNRFLCVKPGQVRCTRLPFECLFIHMVMQEGSLYRALCGLPVFIGLADPVSMRKRMEQIVRSFRDGSEWEMLHLHALLLETVYMLIRDAGTVADAGHRTGQRGLIEEVLGYIDTHLSSDLSLNTLAARISLSPVYFHNCFRRATGRTLRDYVEEQRIRKAVDLLLRTDATLSAVALECGFSSGAYFSHVFRRRMKITPREYVRRMQARYEQPGPSEKDL